MLVVLLSTYDLGRQPFGLASPCAWLREAGFDVRTNDVAVEPLDEEAVRAAGLVAIHLPMHTATRLAVRLLPRVRALNPTARLVCYGLYARPNETYLRSLGVDDVLGGEYEADLVALVRGGAADAAGATLPRLAYRVPDRSGLPPLERYARLVDAGGRERVVGYTETTRGCKHECRHCPVVPVYEGRFRAVPREVVLADIRQQVEAGATHITFGDPDFWNGPTHALAIVRALAVEHPGVTYDATIKIEHLLRHAEHLTELASTSCLFVTSAAESLDDRVLARLDKGHTRSEFERALELCGEAGLVLQPTFIAFHPWMSRASYLEFLEFLEAHDLVEALPPIQLVLRLLVPARSKLLGVEGARTWVEPFEARRLVHPWHHPDPEVDALHESVHVLVQERSAAGASRREIFDAVWEVAHGRARELGHGTQWTERTPVPYLTEPWYC
ncbi:MAG TPA: CUAEP/CCAEP-tail radical SAM protein [Candidatus Eisenbacteria bacterium]|nr:CUAEP/CCAEP-tail radical SAM protein [Candidatus Eisenbacteria bacterium]